MAIRQKLAQRLFFGFFALGLGAMTIVLLTTTGEERNYEHYVKLLGVAVLWFVFIVLAFDLKGILNLKVVAAQYDKIFVLIPLTLILIIILAMTIQAILSLNVLVALLLSPFIFGLFNFMRDLIKSKK